MRKLRPPKNVTAAAPPRWVRVLCAVAVLVVVLVFGTADVGEGRTEQGVFFMGAGVVMMLVVLVSIALE